MIQRIQSVYLFLAGLLPAFTFWLPLARFSGEGTEGFHTLYATGLNVVGSAPSAGEATTPWALIVIGICCVLLPLIALFGYKNRKAQMRKTRWAMLLDVAYYVALSVHVWLHVTASGLTPGFALGCLCPLLSFLFLWLALRAIRKDEALVRAADRIR